MNIPAQVKPAAWGVIGGAAALAVVGFMFSGWVTAGTAAAMAKTASQRAVIEALATICVTQFNAAPDAEAKLVELKALGFSPRAKFVADGGWAIMPGAEAPVAGVDQACATTLAS